MLLHSAAVLKLGEGVWCGGGGCKVFYQWGLCIL